MTGYKSKRAAAQDRVDYGSSSNYPPQPAQEPASVTYKEVADTMNALRKGTFEQRQIADEMENKRLYTTPPQRPWVGLTEDELVQIGVATGLERAAVEIISSKLKEKNNG